MSKNQLDSLLSLARDQDRVPVQIGSSFQTTEATQNSPLSYTTGKITLVVPDRAVELIVFPTTDMRVSEDVNMTTYDIVPAGAKEAISCARMSNIYLIRDSASGTLRFRWTLI